MAKNIVKTIVMTWALLAAYACGNHLDNPNPNRLASNQFYENQGQAVAAVDAIYNQLIVDGAYMRTYPTMGDGRGDEMRSNGSFPMWDQTAKFIIPPTEAFIGFVWRDFYIMISRANQVLEHVPAIPNVDEALRTRLLGQAYFFRGFAYFNLGTVFEIPPIVLKTPEGAKEFYPSNAGVTQKDVYEQAKADVLKSIDMLPDDYSSVTGADQGQAGRITRGAARSLMGKILLYQGDYAGALPYFKAVVDSKVYSLGANYADLFTQDPAVEASVPERIFWVEFTTSTSPGYNWGGGEPDASWRQFLALAPTYSIANFGDYATTAFLYNEMRKEKTIAGKLDPRYHATILSYEPTEGYVNAYGTDWVTGTNNKPTTSYWIKKYTLAATGGDPFSCGINYHIIRYADVLLMYAECLANTGDIAGAAAQVQTVRNRASLPNRQAEFAAYNLTQFMDQLAHERIMELAVEGLRWYDIVRWGWLDNPAKLAQLKLNDPEFNNFVSIRKFMPIPQSELDLNVNLVGNHVNKNQ